MSTKQKTKPKPVAKKAKTRLSSRVKNDRSFRQVVSRIDTWSVLKVSLCFHTGAMMTTIVVLCVSWWTASTVGIIRNIESFMGTVFEIDNFSFMSFDVLVGVILIGLVLVAIMTIISVMSAALYNIFAEAVGGVEIYIVEETTPSKLQ